MYAKAFSATCHPAVLLTDFRTYKYTGVSYRPARTGGKCRTRYSLPGRLPTRRLRLGG